MSLAGLSAAHQQAVEGTMSPEVAALQEIWSQWGIPSQEKKAVHRTDERETKGCRVAGTLGVLAPSRCVISELLGLTGWFCDATPRSSKSLADGRGAFSSGEKLPAHSHNWWSATHRSARPQKPTWRL